MYTEEHPLVLTLIVLDITRLSTVGISSTQNFLRRSNIEQISILCSPVDRGIIGAIAQVLCSVQWSVLKSLTLLGDNIDEWIQLWAPITAPSLLSLEIRGTGSTPHELSHSSVLFLHKLVSASPLVEFRLKNVLLQDKHDWVLIIDCMDPLLLQMCQLCERGIDQLISDTEAVRQLVSRFRGLGQEGEMAQLILKSFTFDISRLSEAELASTRHILSRSDLSRLLVVCTWIDPELIKAVDQVLQAIHWATVVSLELQGNSIDEWVQLYASFDALRLQRLTLCGTGSPQKLSVSSVQVLTERFLRVCPLVELTFDNMVLEDPNDWKLIVECIDPGVLKNFHMCQRSRKQFWECTDAVQQYNFKYRIGEFADQDSDVPDTEEGSILSDEYDWENKDSPHSDNDEW